MGLSGEHPGFCVDDFIIILERLFSGFQNLPVTD